MTDHRRPSQRNRGLDLAVVLGAVVLLTGCAVPVATPESGDQGVVSIYVAPASTPPPTYHPTLGRQIEVRSRPPAARLPELQAEPRLFDIDLYRRGDFVAQARADWCVPASIRTMMNIIDEAGDRTRPSQARLDRLARSLSSARLQGAGSEPERWAGALNKLGYGPYGVRAERTRGAALRAAARAIRLAGKPVGLLMWRGAHAWVVSGFGATADPAKTNEFTVTHLYVEDPWYPRVSSIWGRSRPPNTRVAVASLRGVYLPWRRAVRYVEKDGRFVLVVPVVKAAAP